MLDKYKEYIKTLTSKIDGYFNEQKEFIFCKAGCSICCQSSYYAASKVEYDYVREGLLRLDPEKRELINNRAIQVIKSRKEFLKTNSNILAFSYECPLLIDNACCNYEYRPMLCRSHGLIYIDVEKQNKFNAPFCMNQGLNYSNIWDPELNVFSQKKSDEMGITTRPEAFDLSYSVMMKESGNIDFGEVRMMAEWIVLDIPNHEELIKD